MKLCPTCQSKYPDDANFCPQETCATPEGPQRLHPVAEAPKARFQPGARLAAGSTGELWRARDGETGQEVAYKVVAPEVLPSATALARAEREFKQLMRVQSSRIATVLDCGRTPDDRLFVATELVQGESLERMLKNGPMPLERAKALVAQIGQALLEAQKAGIVHRDVAPKNVLVAPNGDVKVINFPLARPVNERVAGVPAYVSPEQAQGKPVDQRSNTYSLACILYHLLTGEPPFTAPTPQAVLDLHVSSPPLPPSQRRPEANLSPDVDRVLLKALDKNSSRRHLTLRLFLTEVEALTSPAPVAPAPAPGTKAEVGFAKTMLFAGGQAEVANLVAKAIAARTGGVPGAAPGAMAPNAGTMPLVVATTTATVSGNSVTPVAPAAPAQPAAVPSGVPAAAAPPAQQPARASVANTMLAVPTSAPPAAEPAPARLTPPPVTPAPVAAPAHAHAPVENGAGKDVKPAFRETLWFKKGDVDQMVAEAKARMASQGKLPEGELPAGDDVRPIEDRYVDDGTLTAEDRKKFSLSTGGTGTAVPTLRRKAPDDSLSSMSDSQVIREFGGNRKTVVIVAAAVVAAVALVAAVLMMRGGGSTSKAGGGTPAAAVAAPASAPTPPPAPPKPAAAESPKPQPAPQPVVAKREAETAAAGARDREAAAKKKARKRSWRSSTSGQR